jgi:hypothetical protein
MGFKNDRLSPLTQRSPQVDICKQSPDFDRPKRKKETQKEQKAKGQRRILD